MAIPNPYAAKPKATDQVYSSGTGTPKATTLSTVPNPSAKPAGSPANTSAPAASIPDPYANFGGKDAYAKSQNDRWQKANADNDTDLMGRLIADSKKAGYTLNPYSAPAPADKPDPLADDYQAWKTKTDESLKNYETLANKPFSYDPETDPGYLAQRELAQQRAGAASQAAMESLNERGILNSSVTGTQLGQIRQDAEQEALAYIPQYRDQARADYQDRLRNAADLLSYSTGRGDTAFERDYRSDRDERADMETDRNYDRSVLESDRAYDQQQWSNRFNYGTAVGKFANGRETLDAQDRQFNQDVVMAQLTGMLPNGQRTTDEQQRQLTNLWTAADQTGVIPDTLADFYGIPRGTQTQAAYQFAAQFNRGAFESDRNFNRGAFESDRNFDRGALESDRNYDLSADDNARQWANMDFSMANQSSPNYDGMTTSQVVGTIQSQLYDKDGKLIQGKRADPETLYNMVADYNLPDGQDDQAMVALGLTKKQIADLDEANKVTPGK